jgi:hypothetical protein
VLSESTDRVLDFTYKGPHNIMENVIKEICCTVNPVLLECNRIDVKLCSASLVDLKGNA